MRRDIHHHFIRLIFRQGTGVNGAPFQEDQRRLHTRSFVAVKESLTFGNMKAIGSGDFKNAAAATVINVLGRSYGGL